MNKTRYWVTARGKVAAERRCRVCGSTSSLQAAHVIGRQYDPQLAELWAEAPTDLIRELLDEGWQRIVMAEDVVPLCISCHQLYDQRRLDLLPYLTHTEQAAAVSKLGIIGAFRRIASTKLSHEL